MTLLLAYPVIGLPLGLAGVISPSGQVLRVRARLIAVWFALMAVAWPAVVGLVLARTRGGGSHG